jgi:hypothetical protein
MRHDPQLTIEKLVSTPSLLDEATILAEAQRLRSELFRQWLKDLFASAGRSAAHARDSAPEPAGPLKWYGS